MIYRPEEVTAVIPAYNEEKTISEVVKVAASVLPKVIVVDDGSKDSTRQVVEGLNLKNVDVYRTNKNYGKSEAVQLGLEFVTTPYVMFLDADLVGLMPIHLRLLILGLKENPFMVVGLRDRRKTLVNLWMRVGPKISGERVVQTGIVKRLVRSSLWKKYNMELVMNYYVKRLGCGIAYVELEGYNHVPKYKKWGLCRVLDWVKMTCSLTALTFFLYVFRPRI